MASILINATNLKVGGALQVANSICVLLKDFPQHDFTVVLSDRLDYTAERIRHYKNVTLYRYTTTNTLKSILSGRDSFLDNLVKDNKIDCVLTIFGPSRWRPRCFHLCGFAMPHVVIPESPYWKLLSPKQFLRSKLRVHLMKRDFKVNNEMLWCENEYISTRLRTMYRDKKVNTVTNTYNQVFDQPERWDWSIKLPDYDGVTLLTVTAHYPHKNLPIALKALQVLKHTEPQLNVRFVFTINREQYVTIPHEFEDNFVFTGPITINQCPPLYEQCDVMLQPSLLECFSATYAEAMRMGLPILTTDMGFAKSLCGNAAIYYDATDASDLARCIVLLCRETSLADDLITKGKHQLDKFDTATDRAKKLIRIIENSIK